MAKEDKRSFVLYYEYREHLQILTDEERGKLLMALLDYGATGETQKLEGAALMAFSFITSQMDRDAERYAEKCKKRSEAGKQGGRPRKAKETESATDKPNAPTKAQEKAKKANAFSEKQTKAKKADTDTDNDNDTDNDTDNDINTKTKEPKKSSRKKFIIPSVEEVRAYCRQRNNRVDPEAFVAYYTAKDWMIGKNRMKDWKAAVITWERRAKQADKSLEFNRQMVVDDEFFRKKIGGDDDETRHLETYSGYA